MRSTLTTIIVIAMLLGIVVGYACHTLWPDPATAKSISEYISLMTDVFLRLIKMIIAPLVFSTLVVGVAHMGDPKIVGRIGAKAMLWFVSASLVSLLLGLVLVNILRPGDNLNLPLPDAQASTNLKIASLSAKDFVAHLVPRSIIEAMANNEILQIVVFSLFFGVACAALGERAQKLVEGIEELSYAILTITGYIMKLAPLAVFASVAAIITTQGLGILVTYGKFVLEFYIGLVLLWGSAGRGRLSVLRRSRDPAGSARARAVPARLLDREQRGGLSEIDGAAREVPGQQEDHQLRAADGLFVQSRRLDDVLHLRDHLHRAGLQYPARHRPADHHAAVADAHQQGHGRRAARFAGRDRRDARELQPAGIGPASDHRHRPVPRHGPLRHQCDRQFARDRRGGEMGG